MKACMAGISTCSRPAILRCTPVAYFGPISSLRGASFDRPIAARAIRSRFFEAPIRHSGLALENKGSPLDVMRAGRSGRSSAWLLLPVRTSLPYHSFILIARNAPVVIYGTLRVDPTQLATIVATCGLMLPQRTRMEREVITPCWARDFTISRSDRSFSDVVAM